MLTPLNQNSIKQKKVKYFVQLYACIKKFVFKLHFWLYNCINIFTQLNTKVYISENIDTTESKLNKTEGEIYLYNYVCT